MPPPQYHEDILSTIDPTSLKLFREHENINAEEIKKEAKKKLHQLTDANNNKELFTVISANEWIAQAAKRPIPNQLYHELWHEGELCVLFGDTGVGKTILAVQVGNEIAHTQQVIYFDFELTDKQFELRYTTDGKQFEFSKKFYRVEINTEFDIPDSSTFEEVVLSAMEDVIKSNDASIFLIDNITYLSTETEKARNALPMMKHLKRLKNKYHLSMLIIAHTPKRDPQKPLNRNDIQGSKMIVNFADSAFGVGESHKDVSIRYVKQIKARNTEILYGTENIMLFELSKSSGYLKMEPVGFGTEAEHLKEASEQEKYDLDGNILYLHDKEPDLSYQQIADRVGTYKMRVKRVIDRQKS